ncbi:MAG: serine/threonine-protein kinase [Planctomycetota bacterium]
MPETVKAHELKLAVVAAKGERPGYERVTVLFSRAGETLDAIDSIRVEIADGAVIPLHLGDDASLEFDLRPGLRGATVLRLIDEDVEPRPRHDLVNLEAFSASRWNEERQNPTEGMRAAGASRATLLGARMDWEAFYNSFRQPDFIAGYEIENRLGGGAFGDVYKARKTSIGKAYAIKFLKVDDDDQRKAVQHELDQVRHFAAIDHPNLVSIEDMGVVMDVPYLIMGYAGEETLAKRFRAGNLEPGVALQYFTQASRGVLALHDRRLVHFDLKPSNVFIKGDSARVGDYGLSKLLEGGRMTLSFGRGTPMYMAPEMLRRRADHRADIYSLGVILYESLAGEVPYHAEEAGGLVLREHDDLPTFPEHFPAVARPVVEACLRLDPADRPDSVSEVLDLLGQTARPGDSVRFELAPHEARAVSRPARVARERVAAPTDTAATAGRSRAEERRSPLLEGGVVVPGPGSKEPAAPMTPAGAPPAPSFVPVPPKVQGGIVGTLAETTRVGFDVFLGAIVAVLGGVVSGFRTVSDQLVRERSGGFVDRTLRFALFLAIMAGIGFGATLLGLVGLNVMEQLGGRS